VLSKSRKKRQFSFRKRVTAEKTSSYRPAVTGIEKAIGRTVLPSDDPSAILNAEIKHLTDAIAGLQQQSPTLTPRLDEFQRSVLDLGSFSENW